MNMTMRINNFDNYPNFDWDLSRNFYFVSKLGFDDASKKLGMSQSYLMDKIKILENKLGFDLILRDMPIMPMDYILTPKGEVLSNFLEVVFQDLLFRYSSSAI